MRVLAAAAAVVAVALPMSAAVSGTVVGANGTPIANVRVAAIEPTPLFPRNLSAPEKPPIAVATTNAKGEFELPIKTSGVVDLQVRQDGFAPFDSIVLSDEPAGTIALRPVPIVEGRVAAQGKPVAHARVFVASELSLFTTTTGADGKYRAPDPAQWGRMIAVIHPDYAMAIHPPSTRDFELDAGKTVSGKVVDANGKAVAGAAVTIGEFISTTTAAGGTFTFAHVPDQPVMLRATSGGDAAFGVARSAPVTLELQPAARIRGVIRDENKRALGGMTIYFANRNTQEVAISDANGAFTSPSLPRADYQVAAGAGVLFAVNPVLVDAKAGDAKHDVVAVRQLAVAGRVVTQDGWPVANAAMVALFVRDGITMPHVTGAVTGVDGKFRVVGEYIAENVAVRIAAVKPGLPPAISDPIVKARPVTITMPRGVEVSGKVTGPDHKPIAGVRVDPLLAPQFPGMPSGDNTMPAWAMTGDDGQFTARLATGKTALRFTKSGYVANEQEIDVAEKAKPIEIALTRGAELRGHVVDSKGAPVPEAPVMAGDQMMTTSAADGAFSFDAVPPGPITLHFGRSMKEQTVTAPAIDLKLVVPAATKIHGTVTDASTGEVIPRFMVNVSESPQPFEDGHFEIDADESAANVTISATGYLPVTVPAASNIMVSLTRGRKLRGRVTDEKGQPLAGVSVSIGEVSELSPQSAPDGSYEMTGVALDDDTTISFTKGSFATAKRVVRRGRDDVALDVVMLHGAVLTGRVVDASGNGVGGSNVTATSAAAGAEGAWQTTDASGAFHFDDLLPARYDFAAQSEDVGARGAAKDVDVAQVHELTIRVERVAVGTIAGHVTGVTTAARGVMVVASNEEGMSRSASVEANGSFRLTNVPAGTAKVIAVVVGTTDFRNSSNATVEVQSGSEAEVELVFTPQVTLHGHVTSGSEALADVTVTFSGNNSINTVTGADGGYEAQVDRGEYNVILSSKRQYLPFTQHVVVDDAATFDFHVDAITIIASVVDAATKQPIAGATVTASKRGETHTTSESTTSSEGRAALAAARGDVVTIIASHRGHANASQDVTASDDAAITLALLPTPGAVVRIVDVRDGRTLTGYVIARDPSGRVVASSSETDPDGTATLPLAEGAYQVSASAEGYGSHTVNAQIPSSEIRVPLPRGGSLSLRSTTGIRASARLIQPDGQPYVRCWCSGIAEISIEGPVTLVDRVAPGAYTLEVTPAGMKSKRIPVTVIEGQTVNVSID